MLEVFLRRFWPAMGGLALLLALAIGAAVSLGPVTIPLQDTFAIILGLDGPGLRRQALIVDQIRLPRTLTAAFAGAALAVAGAIMQALFRNPLAEPGVTGVSGGAALGAVTALVTGAAAAASWVLPLAAFAGAMGALLLVYAISARRPGPATLLLVGIALGALLSAAVSALVANAPDESTVRGVVFWLQGDLEARTWQHVLMVAAPALLGAGVAVAHGRDLNTMLLGDDQAAATGVDVTRVRNTLVVTAALLTGAAVAVSGIIAFAGLVVPHIVRLAFGPDHRLLLPASVLLGAAFLVAADLGARLVLSPVTLQTGVVTALAGAPVFLFLVLRGAASR